MNKRALLTASVVAFAAFGVRTLAQDKDPSNGPMPSGPASQSGDLAKPGAVKGGDRPFWSRRGFSSYDQKGIGDSRKPGDFHPGIGQANGPEANARRERMMQRFDTNHNGVLDDSERAKMRAAFQERRQQMLERMQQQGGVAGNRQNFNRNDGR